MDLKGRKSINKAVLMWAVAALLLLIMATPALSTLFAAPGSVNTKAIVNGAVKTKKIANGAVTGAKIANGAVTAAKINRTGLNADLLDGKDGAAFVAKASPTWNAQARHYSVPPAAWQSNTATDAVVRSPAAYSENDIFMVAPVHLPDGAVVTRIDFYYDDISSGVPPFGFLGDVSVDLYKRDGATFTESLIGGVWSSGSSGRGVATTAIAPVAGIDNATNTYYLRSFLSSSTKKVEMVIITYTISAP